MEDNIFYLENKNELYKHENNLYIRYIPSNWTEEDINKYFSKYGEIYSMIVKNVDANKLQDVPYQIRNHILEFQYAFVCYKSFESLKKAEAKVPYLKLDDEDYNEKIEKYSLEAKKQGVQDDDIYKFASYIIDNNLENEMGSDEFKKNIGTFYKKIKDNNGLYIVKNRNQRLECFQANKIKERREQLKEIREKKEKYYHKPINNKYDFSNLFVKNIPNDYTNEKLKELFGKFGEIRYINVIKKEFPLNSKDNQKTLLAFGHVHFCDSKSAQEAKEKLNNISLIQNGPKLEIEYFKRNQNQKQDKNKRNSPHQYKKNMQNYYHNNNNHIHNQNMVPQGIYPFMAYRPNPKLYLLQMPYKGGVVSTLSMRRPMINFPLQEMKKEKPLTDLKEKIEAYGDKLYNKICLDTTFSGYSQYFSKIVEIFLDLDENIIKKLLDDDIFFEQQVKETINALIGKKMNK